MTNAANFRLGVARIGRKEGANCRAVPRLSDRADLRWQLCAWSTRSRAQRPFAPAAGYGEALNVCPLERSPASAPHWSAGARRAETVAGQTRRLSRVKYSNWGLYRSGCSTPSSRRSFWRRIGLRAVSQSEPDRTASTTAAWPQGRRSRARGPVGFASWRPQLRYAVARGPGRRWLRISTKRAASARLTCQAGLVR